MALPPIPRAEGSQATQLAEIYAKLEEIEADKAPARYLKFPSFVQILSFLSVTCSNQVL